MNPYEHYGLTPMSFVKEMDASVAVKSTRQNKIEIIDWCEHMKNAIEYIQIRAKNIPEVDDDKHALLVEQFRNNVKYTMDVLNGTASFGRG